MCRAFRNVGDSEGILQVIITGGVHDMTDIAFSPKARQEIEAVGPGLAAEFERSASPSTLPAAKRRASVTSRPVQHDAEPSAYC